MQQISFQQLTCNQNMNKRYLSSILFLHTQVKAGQKTSRVGLKVSTSGITILEPNTGETRLEISIYEWVHTYVDTYITYYVMGFYVQVQLMCNHLHFYYYPVLPTVPRTLASPMCFPSLQQTKMMSTNATALLHAKERWYIQTSIITKNYCEPQYIKWGVNGMKFFCIGTTNYSYDSTVFQPGIWNLAKLQPGKDLRSQSFRWNGERQSHYWKHRFCSKL